MTMSRIRIQAMKPATLSASLFAIMALALAMDALPGAHAASPATPPAASVAPPSRASVVPTTPAQVAGNKNKKLTDDMECLLEPYLVSNVGSAVEGVLSQVLVDRGDVVRKGQVIARLHSSVEQATVNLKRAQEEFGRRKLERNEDLYRKNLIPTSEKDELETQIRVAALEKKQQEEILALRTIVSPVNGVVVARYLAPGDRVSQDKIMRIAQIDPINVEVVMPSELFGAIKPGAQATVSLPMTGGKHTAKVVLVDRLIDAASGTFGVRLALPNPGNAIPAGGKCLVRF